MSVYVIGKGTISFKIHTDNDFVESIVKKMEYMVSFCNVGRWGEDCVYFEMNGKNGINYDQLDEIKDWLLKEIHSFSIQVEEYSECEGGYSFDSEED